MCRWAERIDGLGALSQAARHSAADGAVPPLRPRDLGDGRISRAPCALLLVAVAGRWLLFPGMSVARQGATACRSRTTSRRAAMFTICAFGLFYLALEQFRLRGTRGVALGLVALAVVFLANMLFVVTSRTALVDDCRCCCCCSASGNSAGKARSRSLRRGAGRWRPSVWASSPYLRTRVGSSSPRSSSAIRIDDARTSAGERLDFWTQVDRASLPRRR